MSRRESGAVGTFVGKVRQNWQWGRTHGWADLIEEHDLNPLVRARRGLRKAKWRAGQDRDASATPVFLVGAQRSGTNMMAHGLDEAPEFQVYNEGNARAFRNFRLRPLSEIEPLIERSGAEFVLFKPLCDTHRTAELLDRFRPRARAIWAYRDVDGRVRSALAKFGDSDLQVLRAFAAGMSGAEWQMQGISLENADFIRSLDVGRLSAASAAALFWVFRNSLYFELSLDRRDDAMLASYDRFLAEPERSARALCAFLGLAYRPELIAHVKQRPPAWTEPISIDHRIRERCSELQHRLDQGRLDQVARLVGG